MGQAEQLEAGKVFEGETELRAVKKKEACSKQTSKQPENMLGLQTDESNRNPDLEEEGGQKNIQGMGKEHSAHGVRRSQSVRKAEHLRLNKKKQDSATVANKQGEILDEDKKVQSKPYSQDQGSEIVAGSSNKNEAMSSGDNPPRNVNHEEEKLAHRKGAKGLGASGEISMVKLHKSIAFISFYAP